MTEEAGKEVVHKVTTLEIPVAKDPDTGELVRRMFGKLPAMMLEMEAGYPRGAHLKLELEVRVRRAFTDDFQAGPHKGELYREHHFAIENAVILGVYTADDLDPGVGGGLAGSNRSEEQEQETDESPKEEDHGDDRREDAGQRDTSVHDPGF